MDKPCRPFHTYVKHYKRRKNVKELQIWAGCIYKDRCSGDCGTLAVIKNESNVAADNQICTELCLWDRY